ncbi:MAG TPA: leucine-rich repeat domain-containing protein [Flavobacteriales bacterium]|nr:leucine-rich repeat domain-containing protein [Flavobacteriales bacterium]
MKHIIFSLALAALGSKAFAQKDGIYRSLPEAVLNPDDVITLDLSYSGLTEVPEEVKKFRNMEGIFLQNNNIRVLPSWLNDLNALHRIIINDNYDLDLARSLDNIKNTNLHYLNVANCNIPSIPLEIIHFTGLQTLDFSGNAIMVVPKYLGELDSLTRLDLSKNRIASVSPNIWNCTSLNYIDLSGSPVNGIDTVLAVFSAMPNLKQINIAYTPSTLWSELAVEKLNLSGGMIDDKFLTGNLQVKNLSISNSSITSPGSFFKGFAQNTQVKKLDFTNCDFTGSMGNISFCKNLEDLKFQNCSAPDFSPLGELTNLKSLTVYGSKAGPQVIQDIKANLARTTLYSDEESFYPFSGGPVANIQVPVYRTVINATTPSTFATENVSLSIPANAFKTQTGEPVTGNVQLNYREFFDPLAIAFSGINMKMDTNNRGNYMSSAGMFELSASQNGKELVLDPNKPIAVEVNATQTGNEFGLFKTEENNTWTTLDPQIPIATQPGRKRYIYGNRPPTPPNSYIERPEIIVGTGENFAINIGRFSRSNPNYSNQKNQVRFEEIRFLEHYDLLYIGKHPKAARKQLDSIAKIMDVRGAGRKVKSILPAQIEEYLIEPDLANDCYNLKLKFRGQHYVYPVILTEKGRSNQGVQNMNKKFYAEWTKLKSKKKKSKFAQYEEEFKEYMTALNEYNARTKQQAADNPFDRVLTTEKSMAYVAKFNLTSMTKYNIDKILASPNASELLVNYNTEKGLVKPEMIILVDTKDNTAFTYKGDKALIYNPESSYQVIAVLDNDFIGLASIDAFNKAEKSGTLNLKVINSKNKTISDIRASL